MNHPQLASALLVTLLGLAPTLLSAQTIYRIVTPDGRVVFSDKPPAHDEKATTLGPGGRSGAAAATANLPFELREVVNRYPVTLYTGENCEPCNVGRNLLSNRGVPFTERTIVTAQDVDAMKGMGMDATVPTVTIGSQRLKGFSEEWNDYLDAAGYPKSSMLPRGYRNPPASPLAPVPEKPAPAPRQAPAPAQPSLPPAGPTPDNPSGIVF